MQVNVFVRYTKVKQAKQSTVLQKQQCLSVIIKCRRSITGLLAESEEAFSESLYF